MDLPKRGTRDIGRYFNEFARREMPAGANQHKTSKSRLWRIKRDRLGQGASFDLSGPCQGPLDEVVGIGLDLAQTAIEAGDAELAERILARIEAAKIEYEVAEKEAELARLEAQAAKIAEAQAIVASRK